VSSTTPRRGLRNPDQLRPRHGLRQRSENTVRQIKSKLLQVFRWRRALGHQRPRHAALPASAAPGPGCRRYHRQAVRRAGHDSADNRGPCLRDGSHPCIRKLGAPHGSGLGAVRCVVEHDGAWLLANKRLDRRQDRLGRMILALLTAACIFIIANRIHAF
jgi:hypothetical protein